MLFYHFDIVCKSVLGLLLVIIACVAYTYAVNLRRESVDPKKRRYHPLAIILAPITLPLLVMLIVFLFILRALLFIGFLGIFTVLLIGIRKPFLFVLWDKFATRIGDPLLRLNTHLIKVMLNYWTDDPQPA